VQGHDAGRVAGIAACVVYPASAWGYWRLHGGATTADWVWVLVTEILLGAVALTIVPLSGDIWTRILRTRQTLRAVEGGDLTARVEVQRMDNVGYLQTSVNLLLDKVTRMTGTINAEADAVAALASDLDATTQELTASGLRFADTTAELARKIDTQRAITETGRGATAQAHDESEQLRERAELMASDVRGLVEAAGSSRSSIARAAETLVTVGGRVRESAVAVGALAEASERVGAFVEAVSRIARQTNLLALNAAIEAARAGDQGKGFAVVAEEVRKLAEESGRAAAEIAATVTLLREEMDRALLAMRQGETDVRGVGQIATEADAALATMFGGVERLAEVVLAAADVSRRQSGVLAELTGAFRGVEAVSTDAAASARQASDIVRAQSSVAGAFTASSERLTSLAVRMRRSLGSYTGEDDADR
jgi:methyl-accepting chemotaxis protein